MDIKMFLEQTIILEDTIKGKSQGDKNFDSDCIKKLNSIRSNIKELEEEKNNNILEVKKIEKEKESILDLMEILSSEKEILKSMEKKSLLDAKIYITNKNLEKINCSITKFTDILVKTKENTERYFSLHHELKCREIVIQVRKYIHGYIVGCLSKEDFTRYSERGNEDNIIGNDVSQMFTDLHDFEKLCNENNIDLNKEKSHEILGLIHNSEIVIKNGEKVDLRVEFKVLNYKIERLRAYKWFGYHKELYDERASSIYGLYKEKNHKCASDYEDELFYKCEAEQYYKILTAGTGVYSRSFTPNRIDNKLESISTLQVYNSCEEYNRIYKHKIVEGKSIRG